MDVSKVKGIGPKSLSLLHKIGVYTVDDLVTHYPFRYDVLKRSDLKEAEDDTKVIIDGRVESVPILLRFKANLTKLNFRLVTSSGVVGVSVFNRAFLKSSLTIGANVIVIGKFDRKKNVITASDIKFGSLGNSEKIEAVYHLTSGLTNKNMSTYINTAILMNRDDITDLIPDYLMEKYKFSNKRTALNIVHNPPNAEKLKEASIRLKYEELFTFMFKINYLKEEKRKLDGGIGRKVTKKAVEDFMKTLPFELTGDQKKAVFEILKDMNQSSKMNRLLQGDVGSGKTIVSFIAMYINYLSGYQSALMAPTEILAIQHYHNIREIFKDLPIHIELLTGSTSKKEKEVIYQELENGTTNIVIGTHALIQNDVHYHSLGLVITDEQHRFGVNQRTNLYEKGTIPDVLYMSATPIPRTYALTIYGDMDVSIIKEMPKGRLPVKTVVRKESEITSVLEDMYQELQNGHQIYVIAPLIEETENSDLTNVLELRDKMKLAFGSKYKIDIVHGKMASGAKELIMNEFKQGTINILISTTVVEVGVDVPNASMMVIFDAERFGLSTLHQLRGRVGRGSIQSHCILISNSDAKRLEVMEKTNDGFLISTTVVEVGVDVPNASMMVIFDAERFGLSTLHQLRGRVGRGSIQSHCILISNSDAKRLEVMEKTNDGFLISEEDFKLRGHGDLFGTKQSGDMTFKIASLNQDYKILVQAKKDSLEYLLDDTKDDDVLKKRLIDSVHQS